MEKLGDPLKRILARLGLGWIQDRAAIVHEVQEFLAQRGLNQGVEVSFREGIVNLHSRNAPLRQELSLLQGDLLAHLRKRWGNQVRDVKILRGRKR